MPVLNHPFRLLIMGRPHSGKSFSFALAANNGLFGHFTRTLLFSPTVYSKRNAMWKHLDISDQDIYDKWSMTVFEKAYNKLVKSIGPDDRSLIIIDDCAGMGLKSTSPNHPSPLDQALTTCSHHGISIVIMSQLTNLLPTSARGCSDAVMIFQPTNQYETDQLYKAFGLGGAKKWGQLLQQCTEKSYNFMFVNKSGTTINLYHNFDEQVYSSTQQFSFLKEEKDKPVKRKREEDVHAIKPYTKSESSHHHGSVSKRKRSRSHSTL